MKKSLFAILALSLLVRLISLNQSLWFDESGTVTAVRQTALVPLINVYSIGDFHPPGYFVMLWGWVRIFGSSEVASRLPSVIFGVLTVFLTYLIAKKLFSEKTGLLASFLLALAPLHIYYSQEARMYSFAAFAVALSFYALLKLLKMEKFSLLLYAFSVFLILYSDYVAYFAIFAQLIFVVVLKRSQLKNYLSSLVLGSFTIIPWLFIFPSQLEIGRKTAGSLTGWRDVVGSASLSELTTLVAKVVVGRISFDNKLFYAGLVFLAIAVCLVALVPVVRKMGDQVKLLLIWVGVPVVVGLIVSLFIPIFSYFRFIFILPPFYILLGAAFDKVDFNLRQKWLSLGLVVVVLIEIFCSAQYLFVPANQREDWKGAVSYVDSIDDAKTLVLFKDVKVSSSYAY